MKFSKIKLIMRIVLIVVILVVIGVIIIVGAMNAKSITKQYNELSNKPVSSARQFKIPFGYITVRADGTIDISFAANSEYAQVNPDIDEAEFDGATPDDDRQQAGPDREGDGDAGSLGAPIWNGNSSIKSKLESSDNPKIVKKADILAKVYDELVGKCGSAGAIGILASIVEEGEPGLVQYGHSISNWDGDGKAMTSSADSPLVLGSDTNLNAFVKQCNVEGNKTGIGIVQWTYYSYFNDGQLPSYYEKYCSTGGYTYNNLLNAEIDYLKVCVGWVSGYPPSTTDVALCARGWVYDFENPQDADAAAEKRAGIAEELNKLIN